MKLESDELQNALDILALPRLITKEDIKKQYRYLAKKYHPDAGGDPLQMEAINSAYKLLIDYIEHFRYSFDNEELRRQSPEFMHSKTFKF